MCNADDGDACKNEPAHDVLPGLACAYPTREKYLHPEQAGDRLGVRNAPVAHHFDRRVEAQRRSFRRNSPASSLILPSFFNFLARNSSIASSV